jgi:hypothetical protein
MDTADVATRLGTTPRVLRQFLRSSFSTFQAVGSGGRYDFTDRDVSTIEKRFSEWRGAGKPRPNGDAPSSTPRKPKLEIQRERDMAEWADEGPVELEDIRDPRVRARVRANARRAEDQLMMLLMSKGRHITQLGNRDLDEKVS